MVLPRVRPTQAILAVAALVAGCVSIDLPPLPLSPFDGSSLDGWEGDPRFWRVEDGAIVGECTPQNPCSESSWLVWTPGSEPTELADFALEFDFRCTAGNSGLEFRARRMPDGQVMGLQADLDAEDRYTGGLYEQAGLGRGLIAPAGSRVLADATGELSDVGAAAKPRPARGEWRRYRIEARGPRVRLFVDGELTSECVDTGADFPRAGELAFQLHAGDAGRVELRDTRLEVLDGPVGDLAAQPRWIWSAGEPEGDQRVWFTRELELGAQPLRARLEVACDNACEVRVNGTVAFAGDDWTKPLAADVAGLLRAGANTIQVAARNGGGPAGLLLALDWDLGCDGAGRLVSDASWSAFEEAPQAGASGARAVEVAQLGGGAWGRLGAPSAPARDGALPGDELKVADGYVAELVYSVPRALQGSWVALGFDDRGRALTSSQSGGLYRLTLPAEAGGEVAVELLDDELGGAQGLLALGRDLYLVCSRRGELDGGVWRLRDADGDDRYETRELLLPIVGGGEHGPHALIQAGERILFVGGNHTPLPDGLSRTRVPATWAEDQLLPAREDANGHAWGIPAPGGWLVSMDRDGRDLELVAAGMRNAYDIAIGPEGEVFAYDSDMEWDVGLPWYRFPRLLHLVSGADFGWRRGSGKWPADWPDTLPSVVDSDLASPVGMLYGADLTAFAGRDRAALFIGDWAYGRVLAVDLEPRGASWGGTLRPFLSGTPLPVTDLAAGPDGCLYVTIGGRNTQSGLYRVRPVAAHDEPPPTAYAGAEARARRRALEDRHVAPQPADVAEAWRALASGDPFLRHAGRVVLEGLPPATWLERLRAERDPRAVAQAVVALAHRGDAADAEAALDALQGLALESLDDAALVDALRALALVEVRLGGVPQPARERLAARLAAIAPRGREHVDRELVRTLVALDPERAVAVGLPLLEGAATQEDAVFYANVLVEARLGWNADMRARFLAIVDALPERYTGGNSFRGFMLAIAADAHARLGDGDAPAEVVARATYVPPARPAVHDWTVDELVGAEAELASDRDFERGRALFREMTCYSCHRMRGEGGGTGPDLTGAGSRFSLRDLLEAVLEPSAVVSDLYAETEVLTTDDELIVGQSVSDRGGVVRILKLPPDERVVEIPRDEVAEMRPHAFSRMPEGLVDGLEREELLDLIAFLRAGGDARAAAFQPTGAR